MAERTTIDSFVIRIYRYDTEDGKKIAGMIEATDGSGVSKSFTNTDEIGAILSGLVNRHQKG